METHLQKFLDINTAWGILNEAGVKNFSLTSLHGRENAVRKFLETGNKAESLFPLLQVSKHSALKTDIIDKITSMNLKGALASFADAPEGYSDTIIEEVLSLAEVAPREDPIRNCLVSFLNFLKRKMSKSSLDRLEILQPTSDDEDENIKTLQEYLRNKSITDDFGGSLLNAVAFVQLLKSFDSIGVETQTSKNMTVANLNITMAGNKNSSVKAKLDRFCSRLEWAIHEYLSNFDRASFERPFQLVTDQDFTNDCLKLNFESLRQQLIGGDTKRMEELIDDIIDDCARRRVNERVIFACFNTKPAEEVNHTLNKLIKHASGDTLTRLLKIAAKYFKRIQGYASIFNQRLQWLTWQKRVATLLEIPEQQVDFQFKDELCLRMMAKSSIPFEVVEEFIDCHQIPKNSILFRFLHWQFDGEDDSSSKALATISSEPRFTLRSYSQSISSNWKKIEPRLRWAIRKCTIKAPTEEISSWIATTVRTNYERIRFLLEELLHLKATFTDDGQIEIVLSDLEEFEKYRRLKPVDNCYRLPFEYNDKENMRKLIKEECCPTNYQSLKWLARRSVVDIDENELKLKTVQHITARMRGQNNQFEEELNALSEILKVKSKSRNEILAEVQLANRCYMYTAQAIDDPIRASKFLRPAIEDLLQYEEVMTSSADVRSHFNQLKEYSNQVEIKLVLSKNHLLNMNTRRFLTEGRQRVDKTMVLNLFFQLFADDSYKKERLNHVLQEICRIASIKIGHIYEEMLQTWLQQNPIPVENLAIVASVWDKSECALAIMQQAEKTTSLDQRVVSMNLLLKSFDDEEMKDVLEKLKLGAQGIKTKEDIYNHALTWRHQSILRRIGVSTKHYAAFQKTADKVEAMNHMIDQVEGNHATSMAWGELARDFELADIALWSRIFANFVIGDELFLLSRDLKCKKWFCDLLDCDKTFDKTFRQIWSACIDKNIATDPELVVQAIYEYTKPILLNMEKIIFDLIKEGHIVAALQVLPKAKIFDKRIIFDQICEAVVWERLVEIISKSNFVIGKYEVSEMLLWSAKPKNMAKLGNKELRWLRAEAIKLDFVDPFVAMYFETGQDNEIKPLLSEFGTRNNSILTRLLNISRLGLIERKIQLSAMFDHRSIPLYFRPVPPQFM